MKKNLEENLDKTTEKENLSSWAIYGICLAISTIFFFLFGFNSPLFIFNSDNDYQWFMTMGNGLVHGKIPYRDLFEQKGPIVYFVTAFCCLFPTPRLIMLIIEIFSMSLFFFFTYLICKKSLNTFYSLAAIILLSLAIFTSWCRPYNGSTIEEFCLPIYAYFFLCWLEFLQEKHTWNWKRTLYLGLCFGFILWTKFTLAYFILTPMLIWFFITIYSKQYHTLISNILWILSGILIVSIPIFIFYLTHHAIDDLFYVYFFINLTCYSSINIFESLKYFFMIGPFILVLILLGVTIYFLKHRNTRNGWLLLIAFFVNFLLLTFSVNEFIYYYIGLFPYSILGIIYITKWISLKLKTKSFNFSYKVLYLTGLLILCLVICIPCSPTAREWGRDKSEHIPLVIANIIKDYEKTNNTITTLYCYNIHEFGFYNATNKVPDTYYYAKNNFKEGNLPQMYEGFKKQISNHTYDFIITSRGNWESEKSFLNQYYKPYTSDIETSTFLYNKFHFYNRMEFTFVLLIKNV